ncbi:hypothetical protein G5I_04721 [Acromyrmex echinatior]|uniref:Uncharacterized protein n=1 Tax=Acromyrmex echinatior TaxID=103372 RepID=F4WGE7_ACREC|nr:hypothetical protein G5I_04721 [Acromyrmex echinatior]
MAAGKTSGDSEVIMGFVQRLGPKLHYGLKFRLVTISSFFNDACDHHRYKLKYYMKTETEKNRNSNDSGYVSPFKTSSTLILVSSSQDNRLARAMWTKKKDKRPKRTNRRDSDVTVVFAVSPENGTEPGRVYRRASASETKMIADRDIVLNLRDFEYINVKQTGKEWTPFEYRGHRVSNALREHSLGRAFCSPAFYDLAGSLDDVTSDTARRFAPARTPIAGETLKGTRGIRLAAYVLGGKAERACDRGFPILVKQSGDKPVRRGRAGTISRDTGGLRDTLPGRLKSTMMWLGHFGLDLKLPFAMVKQIETYEKRCMSEEHGGNKRTTDQLIRGKKQDQKWYVYRALRKLHYDLSSILGTENEIQQVLILLAKLLSMSGERKHLPLFRLQDLAPA